MINSLRAMADALAPRRQTGITAQGRGNGPMAHALLGPALDPHAGQDWAPDTYGGYYAASVPVYRAVRLRADAVAQAPMKVYQRDAAGDLSWAGRHHPAQQLLDRVNPWWSHFDLWRGVETHLNLWGSSFRWVNKPTPDPSTWEMWLLRPDKVAVVRDAQRYVRGFIYEPTGARFPMAPEEVLWDRYFNPLDEFAGLSPIAPGRLSIDMQRDMLRVNRHLFKNGVLSQNLAFMLNGPLTSEQVEDFYRRLEERHGGAERANRPMVVDAGIGKVENLGLSNREMEFFQGLTFTLQDVARIYAVPPPLMYDQTRATYNNVWRPNATSTRTPSPRSGVSWKPVCRSGSPPCCPRISRTSSCASTPPESRPSRKTRPSGPSATRPTSSAASGPSTRCARSGVSPASPGAMRGGRRRALRPPAAPAPPPRFRPAESHRRLRRPPTHNL